MDNRQGVEGARLEAIRASEEKYRGILASMEDGFCILQMLFEPGGSPVDYLFLETNPVFEKQTGLMDVVGKRVKTLVPDLDRSWFELYGKVAVTGEAIRFENHAPAMGRWFEVHASRTGRPEERLVALIFKDITDRKKSEQALKDSEARAVASERFMRHMLDNLFAFVGVMELDGTLSSVNRAPLEAAGIDASEVVGKKIWDTHWWNYSDAVRTRIRDACVGAAAGDVVRFDAVIRLANEGFGVIDCQIAPLRDPSGRITHLIPSAVDITERSRAESERRKFALLVEASNDFIAITDCNGGITFLNGGGRNLVGLGAGEDPLPGIGDLIFPDDAGLFQKAVKTAVAEGRWHGEFRFHNVRSGDPVPAWSHMFLLRSPDTGEAFALAMVSRNLTQVREKEAQLRQAQKVEAIGRLAGGIAHDFNNLLTAINGYSEMLIEMVPPDDPKSEFLHEIRKSGDRAAALTAQLLAYSRKQIMQPKVMQLNDIVNENARLLRRLIGENIELELRLAPDLRPVRADPSQMHQILLNLCFNARDAMPDGGRLTVSTRNARGFPGRTPEPGDTGPGHAVALEVADTGAGIDPDIQGRIFEPFFTTKEVGKGTGLGLSSVEGIVQQSGGLILVESEPGLGAVFRIFLPGLETPDEKGAGPEAGKPAAAPRGQGSVLLVEDEDTVRKFVRSLLERDGYSVTEARDGLEALERLGSPGFRPDLLLSDVIMPRLGGRELTAAVRRSRPEISLLLMSGYNEEVFNRGPDTDDPIRIIQKPFTPQVLSGAIHELLQAKLEKT